MTAGSTFVGQFIDHDITFDQTSQLGVPQNPLTSPNTRTPALDLDSVFGGGPGMRPDLYVQNADGSVGPEAEDRLRRGARGRAPGGQRRRHLQRAARRSAQRRERDDRGLHCAHILFYNRVLDELGDLDLRQLPVHAREDQGTNYDRFLIARQVTQWHYQWLLVNEHLPQIAGPDGRQRRAQARQPLLQPAGRGRVSCRSSSAPPPTGSVTAWSARRIERTSPAAPATAPTRPRTPFFGLVFDATEADFSAPAQPRPRRPAGRIPRCAAVRRLADLLRLRRRPGQEQQEGRHDDLERAVHAAAPGDRPAHANRPTVLPQRNLLRQLTWALPSGQAVARAIGVTPISASRPRRHRQRVHAVRAQHAALVLHPRRGEGDHGRADTRAGRRPDRHRDADRAAARGSRRATSANNPRFQPFLGRRPQAGTEADPNITGNRTYTRAHFLYYARAVTPGIYR